MDLHIIIKIIISCLALTICYFGVKQDRKERKFGNGKILILIILGLIMSFITKRSVYAIALFFAINLLGVFMSALHILGASDWKLMSTICLFIPIENPSYAIVFAIIVIVYAIIQKIRYTNKGRLKEAFLDEWNGLKVMLFTKQRLVEDNSRGVYKAATVPATEGIVLAFACTLLMLL